MRRVEHLVRQVGGECNQFGCGMPCGIDTSGDGIVAFQIDLGDFAVADDDSAPSGDTSVKQHVVSLVVLIAVTVDALALRVVAADLVVEDLCLFERGEITLSNLHVVIDDIRWLDEAIGQIFVDRLIGHMYLERGERQPLVLFLSPNLYLEAFAL